jgi:hypothetical protein
MQGDMSVSLPPDLFLESDLSKLQEDEWDIWREVYTGKELQDVTNMYNHRISAWQWILDQAKMEVKVEIIDMLVAAEILCLIFEHK